MQTMLLEIVEKLQANRVVLTDSTGFSMTGSELLECLISLNENINVLPQGTRIATILPDEPMTAISLLAMVHHVKVLPINPALSEHEILTILTDSDVQILLTKEDDHKGAAVAQRAAIPLAKLSSCGALRFPVIKCEDNAAGLVLLTSGSTGRPKRVPLTPQQLHLSAARIAKSLQLGPEDRAAHALPMFHIGAIVDLLLAPLIAGGSVHFAGGMGAEFLRDATLKYGATWLQLVPTMLARLQTHISEQDAQEMGQNLRFMRSVSSDLAPQKHKAAEHFFNQTPIIQMYGMTETAGQITSNPMPPKARKYGSVGQAVDVDVRLQNGEIQVKGSCVTTGYEGIVTSEHITHDGWLQTGDLGFFDSDGFLFLTGRIKEMINRGGEKISPHEIEHAALSYEHAIEAAAFARAHSTLGEEVGLAVTLAPNGSKAELEEHLKARLAAFKLPRKPLIISPLPRLGSGKIDRRALAEISVKEIPSDTQSQRTQIAQLVATAWQSVLPDAPIDQLSDTTDFFDAGGDSLSGAQFLFEVERLTMRNLPANLLYEVPEFGAFVQAVETASIRQIVDGADPKHVFLQSRLADWDAPNVDGISFMRVLNANAPGTPLFWCAQEENEYQQLAKAFANKRPLYLMRSLFLMHGKNDAQSFELAKDYASAIHALQPHGEIALGGFCEGAKIMRFVAEHLQKMGRKPKVLISWDQWFDTPLNLPVLHLWSDERYKNYQQNHLFPERAIAPAHPLGYSVIRVGGAHTEVLTKGPIEPFKVRIEDALELGIAEQPKLESRVFDHPFAAHIKVKGPAFFNRGARANFTILIENQGATTWNASSLAPLFVMAQVQNLDGHFVNTLAGSHEIHRPITPNKPVEIEISLEMPQAFLPIKVVFDLVDSASVHASQIGMKQPKKLLLPKLF